MTLKNMIEVVQSSFPSKSEAEIKILLNSAYMTTVEQGYLRKEEYVLPVDATYDLTAAGADYDFSTTGLISFDAAYAGEMFYALPDNCLRIYKVSFIKSDNVALEDTDDAYPTWRVDHHTIYFGDADHTTLSTTIQRIEIEYFSTPTVLSALTDEPLMPSQFHIALVYFVKAQFNADLGKDRQAMYFHNLFDIEIKKAKRIGMTGQVYVVTQALGDEF